MALVSNSLSPRGIQPNVLSRQRDQESKLGVFSSGLIQSLFSNAVKKNGERADRMMTLFRSDQKPTDFGRRLVRRNYGNSKFSA